MALFEEPDDAYPFFLTTGRLVYHFHTRTKTGRSPALAAAAPDDHVQLAEEDAVRLGIADGDWVRLTSRRGGIEAKAKVGGIGTGEVFVSFHFGCWDEPARARRQRADHLRMGSRQQAAALQILRRPRREGRRTQPAPTRAHGPGPAGRSRHRGQGRPGTRSEGSVCRRHAPGQVQARSPGRLPGPAPGKRTAPGWAPWPTCLPSGRAFPPMRSTASCRSTANARKASPSASTRHCRCNANKAASTRCETCTTCGCWLMKA